MTDGSRRTQAPAWVQIVTDDPAWRRVMKAPELVARRAAEAAGAHATIGRGGAFGPPVAGVQRAGVSPSIVWFDAASASACSLR